MYKLKLILSILFLTISQSGFSATPNPPHGVGDVIARDLQTNIPLLGTLGHVALWDGQRVLEVNSTTPAVRKITFRQYSNTKFWGAKYGKASRTQSFIAVNAGWEQRKFLPKYTVFSAFTRPGTRYVIRIPYLGEIPIIIKALFRCDTFVDYSYKQAGVILARRIITPSIVFNASPRLR